MTSIDNTNIIDTQVKNVNINGPKEVFGSMAVSQATPLLHLSFNYLINPLLIKSTIEGSGTITSVNTLANISTGTTTNSKAIMTSNERARYNPGMAMLARFTSLFTSPVAGTTQMIGVGDATNGFFFGYDGLNFGVLRRCGGQLYIRELQITGASTANDNLGIELDGTTVNVAVLASDTVEGITSKIHNTTFEGWDTNLKGDKVFFQVLLLK